MLALMDDGIGTHVNDTQFRGMALLFAATYGHTDCVRLMIECGADTESNDEVCLIKKWNFGLRFYACGDGNTLSLSHILIRHHIPHW